MSLCLWAWAATAQTAAAAPDDRLPELLPHHVTYRLRLDGSRPSAQVEHMVGEIDYRIRGNACAGYDTATRQTSEIRAGAEVNRQEIDATAWEDGASRAYRFASTSIASDMPRKEVEAQVTRNDAGELQVSVSRPDARTFNLAGKVLLPTEHMRRILAAGIAGESHFAAKVYDGATDPARVYDSLAVIGREQRAPAGSTASVAKSRGLTEQAAQSLEGHSFHPVVVSYFEAEGQDGPPAYVMSFSLYDNGVLGDLKIDYGRFSLIGAMSRFAALGAVTDCVGKNQGPAHP